MKAKKIKEEDIEEDGYYVTYEEHIMIIETLKAEYEAKIKRLKNLLQ